MTHFRMTGRDLRAKRERLGLSPDQFARALLMSQAGGAEICALEAQADRDIPGLLAFAVQAISDGYRLPHVRAGVTLQIAA